MRDQCFRDLRVLHLRKQEIAASGTQPPFPEMAAGAFHVETCLRKLWILDAGMASRCPGAPAFLNGIEAYDFLLRLACGLESEIVGETDIFGQIKEAWRGRRGEIGPALEKTLGPVMHALFEDTKEIRSLYIQNLGGASYGSLVRLLLRNEHGADGPLLLVGAGKLAQSVAPWLQGREIRVWNRTREKASALANELASRTGAKTLALSGERGEETAWREAARVVVCIPADPAADVRRVRWLREGGAHRTVVHLGGLFSELAHWHALPAFRCLDDLFEIQRRQNAAREIQIARARRACEERARLRALGGSLSIPHGWEDLAAFA